jgi:hypothetical protein
MGIQVFKISRLFSLFQQNSRKMSVFQFSADAFHLFRRFWKTAPDFFFELKQPQPDQVFLFDFFLAEKLNEFFEIISRLTENGPYPVSFETAIKTAAEAPQVFGDGDEAFRRRAGLPAGILFFFSDIVASTEKNGTDSGRGFEIFPASETEVSDDGARRFFHPFYENTERSGKKCFIIRIADEVFDRDHESPPVEAHLKFRSEFAVRTDFSLFNRTSVRFVERYDSVFYMNLTSDFFIGLFFEKFQKPECFFGFLFPEVSGLLIFSSNIFSAGTNSA